MTIESDAGRRYHIKHRLGGGGFGVVYLADMLGAGGFRKPVALKVLHDTLKGEAAEDAAMRLRDEARVLGLVHHRAIVHVDGLIQLGGRWALIMEYVPGVSLDRLLDVGAVPVGPALEIIGECAAALDAATNTAGEDGQPLGLVHRDIKPPNIQLTPKGEVKVLDFGIAKADYGSRESKTTSRFSFTRGYTAPERILRMLDEEEREQGDDGPEVDIYSLGVVLYELVARIPFGQRPPFEKQHRGLVEERLEAVKDRGFPEGLMLLMRQMLEYDPTFRPSPSEVEHSCWEVQRGLDADADRLLHWAEDTVPALLSTYPGDDEDPLVGTTVSEAGVTTEAAPPPVEEPEPSAEQEPVPDALPEPEEDWDRDEAEDDPSEPELPTTKKTNPLVFLAAGLGVVVVLGGIFMVVAGAGGIFLLGRSTVDLDTASNHKRVEVVHVHVPAGGGATTPTTTTPTTTTPIAGQPCVGENTGAMPASNKRAIREQ